MFYDVPTTCLDHVRQPQLKLLQQCSISDVVSNFMLLNLSLCSTSFFRCCTASRQCCRHPASGYVQGINDLVTPFLAVFLGEHFPREQPMADWDILSIPEETMLEVG